jgi:hypothetical protein
MVCCRKRGGPAASDDGDSDGDGHRGGEGPVKRVRSDPLATYGDALVDLADFKDGPSAMAGPEMAEDDFLAAHKGDGGGGGSGGGAGGGIGGRLLKSPNHNSRMHPRNEYRDRRPDFTALASAVPSFAPLCVGDGWEGAWASVAPNPTVLGRGPGGSLVEQLATACLCVPPPLSFVAPSCPPLSQSHRSV